MGLPLSWKSSVVMGLWLEYLTASHLFILGPLGTLPHPPPIKEDTGESPVDIHVLCMNALPFLTTHVYEEKAESPCVLNLCILSPCSVQMTRPDGTLGHCS